VTFDSLFLQAAEERFSNRIVLAVSPATHAGNQLVVLAPTIEVIATELASLVGVNHHRGFGPSAPYRHHRGIEHQLRGHGGIHGPTHDCSRVQVNHHSQVQPTFMGAYVGDVSDPNLVGLLHREFTLQPVRLGTRWHPHSETWTLVATHRAQLGLAHQAGDAFLPAKHAIFPQMTMHAWTAVNALAAVKGFFIFSSSASSAESVSIFGFFSHA
jgi:hypothetical protein